MITVDSDLTIPDPGDIGTMAHTETETHGHHNVTM